MFHDGAPVNVEGGDEDVLDMFVIRVGGILGTHTGRLFNEDRVVRSRRGGGRGQVYVDSQVVGLSRC